MADNITKHAFGSSANLAGAISGGTVNEYDEVFLTDTNELAYISKEKEVKYVTPRTKEAIRVMGNQNIGALKPNDTIEAGTSLEEFIKKLTQVRVAATYNQPTISVTNNGGNNAGTYEAGTTINPHMKANWVKNDAGALTSIQFYKNNSPIDDATYTGTGVDTESYAYDAEEFVLGDETVSFKAKATYAEGEIKNDNLGDPSPSGHITAGSKDSSNWNYIGARYGYWLFGTGQAEYTTSDQIKAVSNKQLNLSANNKTAQAPIGTQYIMFAVPVEKTLKKCFVTQMNADIASSFVHSTVQVADARGESNGLKDYNVYIYQMASALESPWDLTYTIS